jgi:uncharacterized protein
MLSFLSDYSLFTLFTLAFFSFLAGFIDSIVGGGGLVQLPAILLSFPKTPVPMLMGTNKIAALAGTSLSAVQYAKRIKFNYKVLLILGLTAAIFAYFGASLLSYLDVKLLRPIILGILFLMFFHTFFKKELGSNRENEISIQNQIIKGSLIVAITGFYDGFFGPGTGSFLVLGFVSILGFDFLKASAYAKVVNCFTGIGALFLFIKDGNFIFAIAILMAVCNIVGNYIGLRMAFKNGNGFVRKVFLFVVALLIVRYGYDVFFKH